MDFTCIEINPNVLTERKITAKGAKKIYYAETQKTPSSFQKLMQELIISSCRTAYTYMRIEGEMQILP